MGEEDVFDPDRIVPLSYSTRRVSVGSCLRDFPFSDDSGVCEDFPGISSDTSSLGTDRDES